MVHLRHRNLLQTMAATIFPPFYRHRAAREQYFRVLSSPCGAGTIFPLFYRRRAAREQYFRCFIVAVRRGNNILAVLSSSCGAGTIFLCFIVAVQRGNNIFAVLSSPCGAETIFPPFQCLQCSCKYIPERFWLLQANCERSEMWRELRGDGGGPRAEGKMKSSHSKWNDCFLF